MKKLLSLAFCLAIMGIMLYQTGFFTYIQEDHGSVTNAYVEVEHGEYQRSSTSAGLEPFQPQAALKPAENAYEGSAYLAQFVPYGWHGDQNRIVNFWSTSLDGAVDKIVTATNRGNIPAYVRIVFAFEHLDSTVWKNVCTAGSSVGMVYHGMVTIHGDSFDLYSYTYDQALQPGETSMPSLLQIALDANTGKEDLKVIASGYELMTASQACQAAGLPESIAQDASATQVLNMFLGEITTEQHPWVGQ